MVKMKMLSRIKQYISQHMALKLYSSLILPEFDYADIIYDSISKQNANKLQVMQNLCLKICTNSDCRISTVELHTKANMPLLATRHNAHTCNFVYRGLHSQLSKGVHSMFYFREDRPNNTRAIEHKQLIQGSYRPRLSKFTDFSLPSSYFHCPF